MKDMAGMTDWTDSRVWAGAGRAASAAGRDYARFRDAKGAGRILKLATILTIFISIGISLSAEAPVATAAPRRARSRVVSAARTYLGAPYRYGGGTRAGMDCSGLVSAVYSDALGVPLPRNARGLYAFVELIPAEKLEPGDLVFFDTTGPLSHVGIYEGEGAFIHSASDGPRTGVIESALTEKYWAAHFAGAGRVLPPAAYIGLVLTASASADIGMAPGLRGCGLAAGLSFHLGQTELGLALRPSYDAGLGIGRIPLVLTFALDRELCFFAGPALTIGSPVLDWNSAGRVYSAGGGLLASAGVIWTPLRFRLFGQDFGVFAQFEYDRYIAGFDEAENSWADLDARIRGGVGLRMRWNF